MKKTLLKLVISLTIGLMIGGIPLAAAQDTVENDSGSKAGNPLDFQIEGEPCLDADEEQIAVILEEGFANSTPKDNPNNAFEEVKDCYRVNMCSLNLVHNSLNVLDKDAKNAYVNRMVCQTEIKEECVEKYRTIQDPSKPATKEKPYVTCQKVQVLLTKKGGAGLIYLYVGTIYRWAASIVGILCVLIVIVNGIIISASAGDQQAVTNAKTRITQSIVALVILFLSALILNTANPNFFTSTCTVQDAVPITEPGETDIPPAVPDNVS